MNQIFNLNEYVYVPTLNCIGKIIDVTVNSNNNTEYLIEFNNHNKNSFLGKELKYITILEA